MKRNLDIGTLAGLLFGLGTVFGSFLLEGGQIGALIMLPAMLIVFGGTFATAMIGTPMRIVKRLISVLRLVIYPPSYNYSAIIDEIVKHAMIARKEGILVLEKHISEIKEPFLSKIFRFMIDGIEIHVLRSIAESESFYISERHQQHISMFQRMGGYSPTMGIIGTVMGLIATLANAGEDPTLLIQHIATAFIATLWGVFMANLAWLPIADKLKSIDEDEQLYMSIITEGVVAIQEGEVPSVIRNKLNSMLPPDLQALEKA